LGGTSPFLTAWECEAREEEKEGGREGRIVLRDTPIYHLWETARMKVGEGEKKKKDYFIYVDR